MEEHSPRHEPLFEDDLPDFPLAQPSRLFDFVFGDESEQPGTDWDDLFAQYSQQEPTAVPIQTTQIDSGAAQLDWGDQETQADPAQPAAPREVTVQPDDPDLPPVTISIDLLHSIAHLNGTEAAEHLGLTRNQFTCACHKIGITMWNTYRRQAVPQDIRKDRERQELFKKTHFQVNVGGVQPLCSNTWLSQSCTRSKKAKVLKQQIPSQADKVNMGCSLEAQSHADMDWSSGIQEVMVPNSLQTLESYETQAFASVVAVESAFDSISTDADPTAEKKSKVGIAKAYNEWCVCMSYYMFRYVTQDYDVICEATGINKACLQRLTYNSQSHYAKYKQMFSNMSESQLKEHISTLDAKKHVPTKVNTLNFFDIATIWNFFVQNYRHTEINKRTQIPVSTISAICGRKRHYKITNYFPIDRLLDLQWFEKNWPKTTEKLIVNNHLTVHEKYIDAFLAKHPEFKAIYDERQKVNFVVSLDQTYFNLSPLEKCTRSLFPTLPYPSDWVPPPFPISMQEDDYDSHEPQSQWDETFQSLEDEIPSTMQLGEILEDPDVDQEETRAIQTQSKKFTRSILRLPKKKKISNGMADCYSEWCICMSYFMAKYGSYTYVTICKVTGMHPSRVSLLINKTDYKIYAKYTDKIKTMSKSELRDYILTLEVKKHNPLHHHLLTFSDIAKIWNYNLQGLTRRKISELTKISTSTIHSIIAQERYNTITNFFPIDRLLDLQWFKNNWTETMERHVVSKNHMLKTKYMDTLLYKHPELKAMLDERQKVNFTISKDLIYHNLSKEEQLKKIPFPTLPYPDHLTQSCIQTLCDEDTVDDDEPTAVDQEDYMQYLMNEENRSEKALNGDVSCEALDGDLSDEALDGNLSSKALEDKESSISQKSRTTEHPDTAAEEQDCILNDSIEHPKQTKKRKYNTCEKEHDKYTICYAYYLKQFSKRSARSISETTGIDFQLVYILHRNKSYLYSDYINEIKDMSKEELEEFLRKLQNPQ